MPVIVGLDGSQELVWEAPRVVGVLAPHREIGFSVPVRVVGVEGDVLVALARELDDAQYVALRNAVALRLAYGLLELWIAQRIEAGVALGLAIDAGLHHRFEALLADPGAGDERGDLLLL